MSQQEPVTTRTPPERLPYYMTVKEVALWTRCKPDKVRLAIKHGWLAAVCCMAEPDAKRHTWLVKSRDVIAWNEARQSTEAA